MKPWGNAEGKGMNEPRGHRISSLTNVLFDSDLRIPQKSLTAAMATFNSQRGSNSRQEHFRAW
jgi:hypothetical protein